MTVFTVMVMVALPQPVNCEAAFKQQFAAFLSQGFTPYIAALKIWPHNNGYVSYASINWPSDPEVVAHVQAVRDVNKPKPPTKEDQAMAILERSKDMEDDEYIKAQRLAAEMLGNLPKGDQGVAIHNNVINNRVMVVKDHGSDDDWEAKARAQQAKLIEHAG